MPFAIRTRASYQHPLKKTTGGQCQGKLQVDYGILYCVRDDGHLGRHESGNDVAVGKCLVISHASWIERDYP